MTHTFRVTAIAFSLIAVAAQASAAEGFAAAPFASAYWNNFVEFWKSAIYKQNAVVLGTVLLGSICIIILTRSKAKK